MRSKAGKKTFAFLLSLVLVFSLFASFSSAAESGNSVSMDTQKKFDMFKTLGLMAGIDDKGNPGMNLQMTRAELSVVVSKLMSLDAENPPKTASFTDVTSSNSYKWAYGFVEAATKAGYMVGVGNKQFNPAGKVKIEELATVMVNILKLKTNANAKVSGASPWAQPFIDAALKAKLISSSSQYTKLATRANMIDVAYETYLAKNLNKAGLPPFTPDPSGKKPVVSVGYFYAAPGTDWVYEKFQSAFPEYDIEVLQLTPEAVAAGKVPDVFLLPSAPTIQSQIKSYGIEYDLMPMIRKYKDYIDLSKFDPNLINDIARYSPNGKLYALPAEKQAFVLAYNKEIFDKFGVPYPKDGMTWDEVTELAKKLTRNEGGIQYRGLTKPPALTSQVGMKGDKDPWKVTVNNTDKAKWDAVLNTMRNILNIPNFIPTKEEDLATFMKSDAATNFIKNQTVAMCTCSTSTLNNIFKAEQEGAGFDWDFVTYPQMKENMGYSQQSFNTIFAMSNTVKNPEAAFRVFLWLTIGESRLGDIKNGSIPATTDVKAMELFDTNSHKFDGKNKAALFKLKSGLTQSTKAPEGAGDIYQYLLAEGTLQPTLWQRLVTTKDNNKILNDLQEAGEKFYAAEKAKLKK